MKLDNNNGLIVPFCPALNTLFILYMLLMITNGVILIIYAAKNNQK